MTQRSNFVKQFSKSKNVTAKSQEILRNLSQSGSTVQQHKQEYADTLANQKATGLTVQSALPEQLSIQRQIYNSTAYAQLKKLVVSQRNYMTSVTKTMSAFDDLVHDARIAMELQYRINKIQSIPNDKLELPCLTDVVSLPFVQTKIELLSNVVAKLMDIKAIISEPVQHEHDLGQTLTQLIDRCKAEKSLQLVDRVLSDEIDPFLGVSSMRSTTRYASAAEAKYNNVDCNNLFTEICKLASNVNKLHFTWLVETPRYGDSPPRMIQAINQIPDATYQGDAIDSHTAALCRFNRITAATNLILQVVYPCLATEIKEFTKVCEEIGVYTTLDHTANFVAPAQTEYQLESLVHEPEAFFDFLQAKNTDYSPNFIQPSLKYCDVLLAGVIEKLTAAKQLFGEHIEKLAVAETEVPAMTCKQATTFLSNWKELATTFTGYFNTISGQTTPANSWDTLTMEVTDFNKFKNDVKQACSKNLVAVNGKPADMAMPFLFASTYRNNKFMEEKVTVAQLGYDDFEQQKTLLSTINNNLEALNQLKASLQLTDQLVNTFPSEISGENRFKLSYLYQVASLLSQTAIFNGFDTTFVIDCFKR